jgi:hypothetical protein
MGSHSLSLPQGWPRSLWCFVAAIIVYLLQVIPVTGIFLMIIGASFWSIALVNFGFIGVGMEALFGRVRRLWLVLPILYFGGFYLIYAFEQVSVARLTAELTHVNANKSVPFNPSIQDLVIEKGTGDSFTIPYSLIRHFGVPKVFESQKVHFLGNAEACALVRRDGDYRIAGISSSWFYGDGDIGSLKRVRDYCLIAAPAQPDRPVVRVRSDQATERHFSLPVRINRFRIRDETSNKEVEIQSGSATPLKPFPMPQMGCYLNSSRASWDCIAGFMRDQPISISPDGQNSAGKIGVLAAALGLRQSDDLASIASGVELVRSLRDAAER